MDGVRVVERRAGACLAIKTLDDFLVLGHFALEQIDRDFAFEHDIEAAIDRAHAAGGNDFAQFKLPQAGREHDGMAAAIAGNGLEIGEVTGNPVARFTGSANRPAQRSSSLAGVVCHWTKIPIIWRGTSLEAENSPHG